MIEKPLQDYRTARNLRGHATEMVFRSRVPTSNATGMRWCPCPHREPRLLLHGNSCSHSFRILNSFLNRMFVFIIIGIGAIQKISRISEMVSRLGIVAAILLLPNLLGGCLVLSSCRDLTASRSILAIRLQGLIMRW